MAASARAFPTGRAGTPRLLAIFLAILALGLGGASGAAQGPETDGEAGSGVARAEPPSAAGSDGPDGAGGGPAGATRRETRDADGRTVAIGGSGLRIPRFVSLRPSEVNLRTGPGVQYPIDWVYRRAGMPVEVVAEFENWRKVRDWQGAVGWVHQSMLSGRRTALVTDGIQVLFRDPEETAPPVARLEPGVIAEIKNCGPGWCRVSAAGLRGWLKRGTFWGLYPGEGID